MLWAKCKFSDFDGVIGFISWRNDIVNTAKSFAEDEVELDYGCANIGIAKVNGNETIFYTTCSGRTLTYDPLEHRILCFDMDESKFLREEIENILMTKLRLGDDDSVDFEMISCVERPLADINSESSWMPIRLAKALEPSESEREKENSKIIKRIEGIVARLMEEDKDVDIEMDKEYLKEEFSKRLFIMAQCKAIDDFRRVKDEIGEKISQIGNEEDIIHTAINECGGPDWLKTLIHVLKVIWDDDRIVEEIVQSIDDGYRNGIKLELCTYGYIRDIE